MSVCFGLAVFATDLVDRSLNSFLFRSVGSVEEFETCSLALLAPFVDLDALDIFRSQTRPTSVFL